MRTQENIKKIITVSKIENEFINIYDDFLPSTLSKQSDYSKIDYLTDKFSCNKQPMFISYTNDYSGLDINTGNKYNMESICYLLNDKYEDLSHSQLYTISYLITEIVLNRSLSSEEQSKVFNAVIINNLLEEELYYYKNNSSNAFERMQNTYCSDCSWKSNSILKLVMLSLFLLYGNLYELYYLYNELIKSIYSHHNVEPYLKKKINNVRNIMRVYL